MKHDTEPTQTHEPEHPAVDHHGVPHGNSIREHLVRETLSDLENELTADHHLEDDLDREDLHEAVPASRGRAGGR
jgi:hypothetical protein